MIISSVTLTGIWCDQPKKNFRLTEPVCLSQSAVQYAALLNTNRFEKYPGYSVWTATSAFIKKSVLGWRIKLQFVPRSNWCSFAYQHTAQVHSLILAVLNVLNVLPVYMICWHIKTFHCSILKHQQCAIRLGTLVDALTNLEGRLNTS